VPDTLNKGVHDVAANIVAIAKINKIINFFIVIF
jgi:hypothetical protein